MFLVKLNIPLLGISVGFKSKDAAVAAISYYEVKSRAVFECGVGTTIAEFWELFVSWNNTSEQIKLLPNLCENTKERFM